MKKTFLLAIAFSATAFVISCDNNDNLIDELHYFSATDKGADSTLVRNQAVGKWYDENNNLLLDINKGYENPNFPFIIKDGVKIPQSFYSFDIASNIDTYPINPYQKIDEAYLYGNNVSFSGIFRLIVEGNNGYLWVMRNQPYMIKVRKNKFL